MLYCVKNGYDFNNAKNLDLTYNLRVFKRRIRLPTSLIQRIFWLELEMSVYTVRRKKVYTPNTYIFYKCINASETCDMSHERKFCELSEYVRV